MSKTTLETRWVNKAGRVSTLSRWSGFVCCEQRSGKDIREGVLVPLHLAAVVAVGTGNYIGSSQHPLRHSSEGIPCPFLQVS